MRLFQNNYFKLGLVVGLSILAFLVVLPKTPIEINNQYISYSTVVGGYELKLFNDKVDLDLKEFKKGLDIAGGVRFILQANMEDINEDARNTVLESARAVIERRVNFLEVSDASVKTSKVGDIYRIVVEIPRVANMPYVSKTIGETAQLQFKQLKDGIPWDGTQFQEYFSNQDVWEETGVTRDDLSGVTVLVSNIAGGTGGPVRPRLQLHFSPEGLQKFSDVAAVNVDKPIALFLDDIEIPLSISVISQELANGAFNDPIVNVTFDLETVEYLSIQIRAGELPVPVELVSQEPIQSSLGDDVVTASLHAGIYGLALVFAYMVIVYRRFGLVANVSLILYMLVTLAMLKIIPVVLTVPGIAGFLLSLGLAADANILVLERIREELLAKTPQSLAVARGFEKAWSSIKASNILSLLIAFILFYFGSGDIQGFAATLSVGILVSLFTVVFVVRVLINVSGLASDKLSKRQKLLNFILRKNEA